MAVDIMHGSEYYAWQWGRAECVFGRSVEEDCVEEFPVTLGLKVLDNLLYIVVHVVAEIDKVGRKVYHKSIKD